MSDESQATRTRFILTPEQQEYLQRARRQATEDLPELILQGRRMKSATAEPSLIAALRRAVHRCGRDIPTLAGEMGVKPETLSDFLQDRATLPSDTLDRLAQSVGFQLV